VRETAGVRDGGHEAVCMREMAGVRDSRHKGDDGHKRQHKGNSDGVCNGNGDSDSVCDSNGDGDSDGGACKDRGGYGSVRDSMGMTVRVKKETV